MHNSIKKPKEKKYTQTISCNRHKMPMQETLLNISTDPFSQPVCRARYHHTQSRCAVKAQHYCEVRRRLAPKNTYQIHRLYESY